MRAHARATVRGASGVRERAHDRAPQRPPLDRRRRPPGDRARATSARRRCSRRAAGGRSRRRPARRSAPTASLRVDDARAARRRRRSPPVTLARDAREEEALAAARERLVDRALDVHRDAGAPRRQHDASALEASRRPARGAASAAARAASRAPRRRSSRRRRRRRRGRPRRSCRACRGRTPTRRRQRRARTAAMTDPDEDRRLRTTPPARFYAGRGRSEKRCTRSGTLQRTTVLARAQRRPASSGASRSASSRPVGRADDALLAAQLAVPRVASVAGDDARPPARAGCSAGCRRSARRCRSPCSARPCPTSSAGRRTAGRSARSHAAVASCASVERWLVTWMKWPASCQARDRLDRARVRRRRRARARAGGSRDERGDLLAPQLDDVPRDLLVVGERDAEAPPRKQREQVPVVVQCRVDVDRDAHPRHRVDGRVARDASPLHDGYGAAGPLRLAGHRLAGAPALGRGRRHAGQRDRAGRRARRCCSSTASPAAGRTGWRTSPTSRARTA